MHISYHMGCPLTPPSSLARIEDVQIFLEIHLAGVQGFQRGAGHRRRARHGVKTCTTEKGLIQNERRTYLISIDLTSLVSSVNRL